MERFYREGISQYVIDTKFMEGWGRGRGELSLHQKFRGVGEVSIAFWDVKEREDLGLNSTFLSI